MLYRGKKKQTDLGGFANLLLILALREADATVSPYCREKKSPQGVWYLTGGSAHEIIDYLDSMDWY